MKLLTLAAVALAVTACTSEVADPPPPPEVADPPRARYSVAFAAGGKGSVQFGPGERVCLTLRTRPPKAAHLHYRASRGPSDDVLVTFFEPPVRPRTRNCIDNPDERDAHVVRDQTRRVYVDLHYNPHDDGVVGRLTPTS